MASSLRLTTSPGVLLLIARVFLLALLPALARGAILYDSGGFEPARFINNLALAGQDAPPAGQGPWVKDSGTSTAVVQSTIVAGGAQAVQMTRTAGSNRDTRWGITEPFTPTAAENIVRIDFDMRVNQATFAGTPPNHSDFGPAFGLEVYDSTNSTLPLLIGSVTVDATTGDVLFQQANTGILVETGTVVSRNTFHHFTLSVNFTNKTYSVAADGLTLRTEGFVDNAASRFTDADLANFAATGTSSTTAAGTAFFDNFLIATIPEPGSAAMIGAGVIALAARRRKARRPVPSS